MSAVRTLGPARLLLACTIALGSLLSSCGGGGGGGFSSGGGSNPPPAQSVQFTGFTFRIGASAPTSTPPIENLTSVPSSIGAPLDLTVIFNFTGVPQGPFNQGNLPVFSTSTEVTPDAMPPLGQTIIQAKGTYVLAGNTVEFRPFVPTEPLQVSLSAPPGAVPGLLPASLYTAQAIDIPGLKVPNLQGAGGLVKFGTTSNPAAYYASTTSDGKQPLVLVALPPDGSTGFFPGPYSNFAPGAALPSFPDGPSSFTVNYDHAILPTAENIDGKDWDGDGYVEPNFFLRTRATKLLVGQQVPAGSTVGNTLAFPAISGLTEGQSVSLSGADIFLHNSQGPGALPGASPELSATPGAIALARDPSLLFVILKVEGGNDKLTVVDHVLGDPAYATISTDVALDTGLDDVVGLITLQSGRLIAFDRSTRRLYELLADVTRNRPTGAPELSSPNDDGMTGIGFTSAVYPTTVDVLDLAQAPSGALYALADNGGAFPVILRCNPIDPNLDGVFDAVDGLYDGGTPVLSLNAAYAAIESSSEFEILALNRSEDSIDVVSLAQGKLLTAVSGVAAYGVPLASLPGGLSPACTLVVGYMELDVAVLLSGNESTGAILDITARGVLPLGAELELMQRNGLVSLAGVSAANEDATAPLSVLGAVRITGVFTSAPGNTVAACNVPDAQGRVNDVFQEEFLTDSYEDKNPPSISPLAEWAKVIAGNTPSSYLRASVGASTETTLGDFKPVALSSFDPVAAYNRNDNISAAANFKYVFLDTNSQNFPLPDGSTPGVTSATTVAGGQFAFRDFIIPEGVWVIVRGSNPCVITATGTVEIKGVLDVSGENGQGDNTFDSGFIPVPGGGGGPGGGRGGNGHPTVFNPAGPGTINQYITPPTGEDGFGPVIGIAGGVSFQQIGGRGGLSTLGADFNPGGFPKIANQGNNTEYTRPPGGGGGSFYYHGTPAHQGTGAYLVQKNFQFSLCLTNDSINDALYGNEENIYIGGSPITPLQCVYLLGTPSAPNYFLPGGEAGDLVFTDATPANDFFGPGGELQVLIGGQGGGGGASRIDCMGHQGQGCVPTSNTCFLWAGDDFGGPQVVLPIAPPFYPSLAFGPLRLSPTLYDAKGGGAGGGAGSILLRTFGDILISKTGHIDASGGNGAGGEIIENSNYSGSGGGGSGGAVILQAAGDIRIEAESAHVTPYFIDASGKQGASIDVSGGFGHDARTLPTAITDTAKLTFDFTRSDGGQGGFGLIQLQSGSLAGVPYIQQGAFLFARQRTVLKLGLWTGDTGKSGSSAEHPSFSGANPPPNVLRYIDMLHYRAVEYDPGLKDQWLLLNGSDPAVITTDGTAAMFQPDTPMINHFGFRVVREPTPEKVMKSYAGFDPITFAENYNGTGLPPGQLYDANDDIPLSIYLKEPDGTPLFEIVDGVETEEFQRLNTIDRLPVVNLGKTPPPLGSASRGTSLWLDFNGVALRLRNSQGIAPPLFEDGINGTYNAKQGVVPPSKDGQVITGAAVSGKPASFVAKAGAIPFFDPGLCLSGAGPYPPFNDIKVDAPESPQLGLENAISNNATVGLVFQGAFPIRAGSHVPDPGTLTAWVSDLRELSGYPLVRFQVIFDLAADQAAYPFGVNSFRPAVDRVRMRATY